MSAKWVRSKSWDDKHLTGALWPVKALLRAFSSITLAVILLLLVAVYGILASVPIGLLALIPTDLIYGATLLAAISAGAALPTWIVGRAGRHTGLARGWRFAVGLVLFVGLTAGSAYLWHALAWPRLRYDPVTGAGLRLFAGYVERYQSVQLRRLPGLEMSELEFYSWWPLSAVLLLFVANLLVATVRRIEFVFVNLGVLTVHTGIVVLAIGSAFYATHKREGDMVLFAGGVGRDGKPLPGRADTGFYDNVQAALWITGDDETGWEQRRLVGVPRYNDYNLGVVPGFEPPPEPRALPDKPEAGRQARAHRDLGPLAISVPGGGDSATFRIVGYASYCELIEKWVPQGGAGAGGVSMREFHAILRAPGGPAGGGEAKPAASWRLIPDVPAERLASVDILNIEHTRGMSDQRWADLATPLPAGARHALIVEVPGDGQRFRGVYAAETGQSISVGDTGYKLDVERLSPEPPFPIITKGYEGARSSVAVVRVTPPGETMPFQRWVYHRFPELNQDLLSDGGRGGGTPKRRTADPSIRIAYIDASVMQVYVDDRGGGAMRALVRMPGSGASVTPEVREGGEVQLAPQLALRVGPAHESVRKVEVPRVVPEDEREKSRIGNRQAAAIALEVSDKAGLKQVRWVPFTQYLGMGSDTERRITLGDGKSITVAFGRVLHSFEPAMSVSLLDFQMTPYPHTRTPRDYRSELLVSHAWDGRWSDEARETSLNEPLLVRTPFIARGDVPGLVNLIGRLGSAIAPNQYKFSQAGWDQAGWRESEAAVSRGEAARAFARFTILGVGNSPGIHIIAAGAVLMSVGIPWAFYVKPWILRRRKRKIQMMLAGEGGREAPAPGSNGALGAGAGQTVAPGVGT